MMKPSAERGAEHAEGLRAVLLGRDVGDVGARGRDVAARQAVDDARREQHREAVRQRQHHEADDRADEAEDQHGPPAPAVRPARRAPATATSCASENDAKSRPIVSGDAPNVSRVERQQRDDDAEADQVDEDRQEDDEERTAHGDRIVSSSP